MSSSSDLPLRRRFSQYIQVPKCWHWVCFKKSFPQGLWLILVIIYGSKVLFPRIIVRNITHLHCIVNFNCMCRLWEAQWLNDVHDFDVFEVFSHIEWPLYQACVLPRGIQRIDPSQIFLSWKLQRFLVQILHAQHFKSTTKKSPDQVLFSVLDLGGFEFEWGIWVQELTAVWMMSLQTYCISSG